MEILDLKFAGVPIWIILMIVGVWYNGRRTLKEWRKDRQLAREVDEARRKFKDTHVWKPHVVGGNDYGEWVRGTPLRE
jgi:hypothetical protein